MKSNDKSHGDTGGTIDSVAGYFDERGAPWIRAYGGERESWHEYNNFARRERFALSLIEGEPRGTVVDLGCGGGHALLQMKAMDFTNVVGVDISDNMLQMAQASIAANGMGESVKLLKADVQDLNMLESGSVDVCTALGVIEYLDEDGPLLSEISRLLKLGGCAVVQTRNYNCIHTRTEDSLRRLFSKPTTGIPARYHRPRVFCSEAMKFGFKVEQVYFSHFYAMYPLNAVPRFRWVIRPLDNFFSKGLERLAAYPISRYLASMYIVRLRKV